IPVWSGDGGRAPTIRPSPTGVNYIPAVPPPAPPCRRRRWRPALSRRRAYVAGPDRRPHGACDRPPLHGWCQSIGAGPMAARAVSPATPDVVSPDQSQRNGYPHPEWTWLPRHAPVFWYERPNVGPFWAITKHADIIEISKQPEGFLNAPRLAVFTREL